MNIVKKIFLLLAFVVLNTIVNNAFADGVLKGTITSDWGNGFCYNFNVANTSGSNLTDWKINFKLNTATSISSKWSGNFSNISDSYTITPVDRNKTISTNGSKDIGFCANGTDRPKSITLGSNTVNNSTTGTTNTTTTETLKDNLITKDGLSVNFVASSKRDGGYCRNITLKNTSSKTISNWEISFLLDQAINGWSANYSKSGTKYTVKPMDWNKSINSNTQIEIGFCSVGKLFDKTQVIENVSFLNTTTPTTPTTPATPTTPTNSGSTTTPTTPTNSGTITTVTKPNKLIGYYTSWDRYSYTYDKINYSKFDIINHAFIFNNTDGTLSVPSDLLYPEFVNEVHKNGKKVVISVGNGSSPYNFATMAKNDTSRAKFVSEIKKFITTNNYDGVDIDWEFPIDQIEGYYYLKLMKDLKTALPDKLVTTAISINPSFIDVKLLSDTVDYVYIMAYDIEGGWNSYAGHNAPLYRNSKMPWDMSIDGFLNSKYLNANINKSKFILGLPLYGRKFYVAKPYDTAYYSETIEYKNLPKNCTELWDNESKVPYLSCGSYYISFDNLKSFKEKIDYINTKQLGGAFFWAIGQENGDLINGFK